MNEDGSRGVSSELSIGAELDSVLWIGIAALAIGALAALAGRAGDHGRGPPRPPPPAGLDEHAAGAERRRERSVRRPRPDEERARRVDAVRPRERERQAR